MSRLKCAGRRKLDKNLKEIPMLPLRDVVMFPYMVAPLFVGRSRSIKAIEEVENTNKEIFLCTQIDASENEPKKDGIYSTGVIGIVAQMLRLPDGTVKVLVEGKKRGRIEEYVETSDFYRVRVSEIQETSEPESAEADALKRSVLKAFEGYIKLNRKIPAEVFSTVSAIENPARLSDTVASHLNLKISDKQDLLETVSPEERLKKLHEKMQEEVEILEIEKRIGKRVSRQMEKSQREYYLTEQMKAIQKELGEKDDMKSDVQEIEGKIKDKGLPKSVEERVRKELKKLKMMPPMSAEATVVRNYVDWIMDLPWTKESTKDRLDIKEAKTILDEDHYGLKDPKDRILEYLAVRSLTEKLRGPILCFVGPPGVGKTSLAKSIARSMGRKFVRVSLGGVRDESEIRGHRRTYIGALPGKIIQGMKKAGTNNPVFLLDEIDKLGMDFRGDPASALLECLDPEQNVNFNDHYIEADYDLSKVLFIATANIIHTIPWALQDRMEIIRIPGYTEDEKLHIAKKFLLGKKTQEHGLSDGYMSVNDPALLEMIRRYTKEAGVRTLEREIAKLCRKVARKVAEDKAGSHSKKTETKRQKIRITVKNINSYLGVPKFKHGEIDKDHQIGAVTGLAWTEVGGELLTIEVAIVPGKGSFTVTGVKPEGENVMKESARAAMSYVRSRGAQLGLDRDFYQMVDIHIHAPEGATPKDGPSAGIAIVTAIVSALLKKPIKRDIAMTGEITLRGQVLPIGGLKEKILAAQRGKVKKVILPLENEKDMEDVPEEAKKGVEIKFVEHMDDVLSQAIISDSPILKRFAVTPAGEIMPGTKIN
ncbi:MAG: endopeptidase La [Candidatus Mycalebacterium zealandia]|nr:MAG: endopeptidase La [Candidatus Mycalebacterium zealandia]